MKADLPPHVRAEVQRILDRAARRLLAEELDSDPVGAAARADRDTLDRAVNQRSLLAHGQPIPVGRRAHALDPADTDS